MTKVRKQKAAQATQPTTATRKRCGCESQAATGSSRSGVKRCSGLRASCVIPGPFYTLHVSSRLPANVLNVRCSWFLHGATVLRKGDESMIGCLIAGGIAVFAISRMIHARRWYHAGGGCGSRYGGWHGWHGRHHGRHRGWGGYGPDHGDPWGPSFHDHDDHDHGGWGGGG